MVSGLWFVYMLRCDDGSYYTGITLDIDRRLAEHNSKSGGCRYTRSRQPVQLLVAWEVSAREQALQVEYYIKHRLARKQKQALIDNPLILAQMITDIPLYPVPQDVNE